MVHVSTSDVGKCGWVVLEVKPEVVDNILKSRTPVVAFSVMTFICSSLASEISGGVRG